MPKINKVIIDSREKERKNRASEYYKGKIENVEIKMLETGDYVFCDDEKCVAFEYKKIDDYMQSILNESLFNQAVNQSLQYPFSYIIVVGSLKSHLLSNWRYTTNNNYEKYIHEMFARYYGALRRLRSFTTTIEVETEEQAFQEMLLQSEKCLDKKVYGGIVRPVHSHDPVSYLLCGVKMVSSKKAERIRKHHSIDNLYDLLQLSVEDFKQVKGIGELVANNIYEFIHTGELK